MSRSIVEFIMLWMSIWVIIDGLVLGKRSMMGQILNYLTTVLRPNQTRRSTMKNRIDALKGIGMKARKITTEIAGNYAICVATEPASKKKNLCIYESAKKLSFTPGAVHQRKLVKAFPYSNEEGLVAAHKEALKFLAKKQGKIGTEVGDEISVNHGGKTVKAKVLEVS